MIGTLDRVLEDALCDLIEAEATTAVTCVPHLMGAGEANAVCPRIVVICESQESPDFQEVSDGIYGVYPVNTIVSCIVEATSATSSDQLSNAAAAADDVLVYNGGLSTALTAGQLKVYGVVPGTIRQEMEGNRIIRHREMLIWARLQGLGIATESGMQLITEAGAYLVTE